MQVMHVLCSDVQDIKWSNDILLFADNQDMQCVSRACFCMTVMTQTPACSGADAQQASPASHLCHDADQPGVIERVGGGLGSAPVVDMTSEGCTSVSIEANGLMRHQGSTAWSDNIENINAGMFLAPRHVLNQTNSILMVLFRQPFSAAFQRFDAELE